MWCNIERLMQFPIKALIPKPCKGHKKIREKRKKLRKASKAGRKAARKNDA